MNFDLQEVKELIDFLEGRNLSGLELSANGCRIRLKLGRNGKERKIRPIRSNVVGTFYFNDTMVVKEGVEVKKGDKLGCIEALKLSFDVILPFSGRIEKIYVENGYPVEYNEVIFEVYIP